MSGIVPARGNIFGKFIPARYVFAILGSIGLAIIYGVRDNFALFYKALHFSLDHSESIRGKPEMLYAASMMGSFISQIPTAFVMNKISAKWIIFFSVALNIVCYFLTPIASHVDYKFLVALRFMEGIGVGATFPAMHSMIAAWSPPNQRTVISTIIYVSMFNGGYMATFISNFLSYKLEWQTLYYIMCGLSCIWLILWFILIQDTPNKQRFISHEEREMINSTLSTGRKGSQSFSSIPWRCILKSKPFWAIFFTHSLYKWGMYIYNVSLAYKMYITNISCIYGAVIVSILLAIILDILRAKQKVTTTVARKIATGIATLLAAICALIFAIIAPEGLAAEIILSISAVGMGSHFSGFLSNHIDIAPNHAGILGALTNTVATMPAIVIPFMSNSMEIMRHDDYGWYISFVLFIVGFFVFVIFGSGAEQTWNRSTQSNGVEDGTIKPTSFHTEVKEHEFRNLNSWQRT